MTKSLSPWDRRRRPGKESKQFERAWAIVSRNPAISRRELAAELGLHSSAQGQRWMQRLAAAGVIELLPVKPGQRRRQARGVRVVIPLAIVETSKSAT